MQDIETLQKTAMALYVGMDALMNLHVEVELEGNEEKVASCAHCSALADGVVVYPCPTVQILLTDVFEDIISETSEPAESEEPSS